MCSVKHWKVERTQVDSCNATTTSTHNCLQQNTFLVTKIAFQTERSGTLWILQFCKLLKTTSVAVAATTFFLITPAQTHVELPWKKISSKGKRLTNGQMGGWLVKPKLRELQGLVPLNQASGSMMSSSFGPVKS
jgi:hypothetical protein